MKLHFGRKTMMGAIGTLVAVGIGLAVDRCGWYRRLGVLEQRRVLCDDVPLRAPGGDPRPTRPRRTHVCSCVECHMGRLSTLQLMALKPTHVKELWGMIAGYERPLHSSTAPGARELRELPLPAGGAP